MILTGKIKKIIFENLQSGYTVMIVCEDKTRDEYTLVAYSGVFNTKEIYEFEVEHILSAKYGDQWEVIKYNIKLDSSVEGITKYLISLKLKGIGQVRAKYIVEALGLEFFEKESYLRSDLDILLPKLGSSCVDVLYERLVTSSNNEKVKKVLFSFGLGSRLINKLINFYHSGLLSLLQTNPYKMIDDIDGIAFKKADEIALKMGLSEDSSFRFQAAIFHIIKEIHFMLGNSYALLNEISDGFKKLINLECDINYQLGILELENKIVIVEDKYYLSVTYNTEKKLRNKLVKLSTRDSIFDDMDYEGELSRVERDYKIKYTPSQRGAILKTLRSKFSIITGGPGTGKTTITKAILEVFLRTSSSVNFKLCAPTGKAAKRLGTLIGSEATTIHMLLEVDNDGGFKYNEDNLLDIDFIIIDEASMLDLYLANDLFSSLNNSTKVLVIGDVNQLPSIAPGQILFDMINSNLFEVTILNEIMRTKEQSNIVKLSKSILDGNIALNNYNSGDVTILKLDSSQVIDWLKSFYLKCIEQNKEQDLLILAPKRSGSGGIDQLNKEIQDVVIKDKTKSINHYLNKYYINDKIIQTRNNYAIKVMNGEIGNILYINPQDEECVSARYNDNVVSYDFDSLKDTSLAYALSVHKAQGSEAKAVVFVVSSEAKFMLNRELIYTAITRAKEKLYIIGEPGLLHYYSQRIASKRKTSLFDFNNDK